MPKQFEVTVSVLQKKTFIVEADDAKHARSEMVRLGYWAESYTICKLVDKEVIQFDVLAVKGEEQLADWNRNALRAALHPIIDTCASEPDDFESAALAQLSDSGVKVIHVEDADEPALPWDKIIRMKGADNE
jgi:hypothetical protein